MEEQKILQFLRANGVTTLELIKEVFKRAGIPIKEPPTDQADEEVVFVDETPPSKVPKIITKEQISMLIQASTMNKEKIIKDLIKIEEKPPHPVVHNIGTVGDHGHNVNNGCSQNLPAVNAGCPQDVPTLPMRYRHKHTQASCVKGPRSQRTSQARQTNNIIHAPYNQYHHYHQSHNMQYAQNILQAVTPGIVPGFNNHSGYNVPLGSSNNMLIPLAPTVTSSGQYNSMPQQPEWPVLTMTNTGPSTYHFPHFPMAPVQAVCPQVPMQESQQQPGTHYMAGNRSIFEPN